MKSMNLQRISPKQVFAPTAMREENAASAEFVADARYGNIVLASAR